MSESELNEFVCVAPIGLEMTEELWSAILTEWKRCGRVMLDASDVQEISERIVAANN